MDDADAGGSSTINGVLTRLDGWTEHEAMHILTSITSCLHVKGCVERLTGKRVLYRMALLPDAVSIARDVTLEVLFLTTI